MEIPGYKILKELGKGGMATVYLSQDDKFDRQVALKVMSPQLMADEQFAKRFIREAKIVARLSHPHIVPVYDVGDYNGYYYMAMDLLTGGDLTDKIKKGPVPEREALRITREIAMALDYAHNKGYIHRDIKPDNIMFREEGSAVLTDFGIARPVDASEAMTQIGTVIGTPKYMSPEQSKGEELDGRADLYSLGIVFYQMLYGTPPYVSKDPTALAIMHIREPIPTLTAEHMHLQAFFNQFIAKDRMQRFFTGAELAEAIQDILDGKGSQQPTEVQPTKSAPRGPQVRTEPKKETKQKAATKKKEFKPEFSINDRPVKKGLFSKKYYMEMTFKAEEFAQFQKQFEQAHQKILAWQEEHQKKCGGISFELKVHNWIIGRCMEYINNLYHDPNFEFMQSLECKVRVYDEDDRPEETILGKEKETA